MADADGNATGGTTGSKAPATPKPSGPTTGASGSSAAAAPAVDPGATRPVAAPAVDPNATNPGLNAVQAPPETRPLSSYSPGSGQPKVTIHKNGTAIMPGNTVERGAAQAYMDIKQEAAAGVGVQNPLETNSANPKYSPNAEPFNVSTNGGLRPVEGAIAPPSAAQSGDFTVVSQGGRGAAGTLSLNNLPPEAQGLVNATPTVEAPRSPAPTTTTVDAPATATAPINQVPLQARRPMPMGAPSTTLSTGRPTAPIVPNEPFFGAGSSNSVVEASPGFMRSGPTSAGVKPPSINPISNVYTELPAVGGYVPPGYPRPPTAPVVGEPVLPGTAVAGEAGTGSRLLGAAGKVGAVGLGVTAAAVEGATRYYVEKQALIESGVPSNSKAYQKREKEVENLGIMSGVSSAAMGLLDPEFIGVVSSREQFFAEVVREYQTEGKAVSPDMLRKLHEYTERGHSFKREFSSNLSLQQYSDIADKINNGTYNPDDALAKLRDVNHNIERSQEVSGPVVSAVDAPSKPVKRFEEGFNAERSGNGFVWKGSTSKIGIPESEMKPYQSDLTFAGSKGLPRLSDVAKEQYAAMAGDRPFNVTALNTETGKREIIYIGVPNAYYNSRGFDPQKDPIQTETAMQKAVNQAKREGFLSNGGASITTDGAHYTAPGQPAAVTANAKAAIKEGTVGRP